MGVFFVFFFSSRRRHTRCALVTGVQTCALPIFADGARVQIGREFPGFAYPQEELAAAIAHELAHNLLGHRAWLDGNGRNMASVRLTEREAEIGRASCRERVCQYV